MLAVTGQPTGSNVYAIIEASNGTVYQGSSFASFTTQAAAAIVLTETPTGSERYRAAYPTLTAGDYSITYFLRAGANPAVSDRPLGAEDISIAAGGNITVTITNGIDGSTPAPLYPGGEISVYQNTSGVIPIAVTNENGPVTLAPNPTLTVFRDSFPQTQSIFTTVASVSGNVATASYSTGNTAVPGRYRYQLVATDGTVLATGLFVILNRVV